MEIAEKMEKKLLAKVEAHRKHPDANIASQKTVTKTGDKSSKAGTVTTASPNGTSDLHIPLPGTVQTPSPSQSSSSARGDGSSAAETKERTTVGRQRSKTMLPATKVSPNLKTVGTLRGNDDVDMLPVFIIPTVIVFSTHLPPSPYCRYYCTVYGC